MSKKLSILLLFMGLLQADYPILDITKEGVSIEKTAWPIGSSGVIIRHVNNKHEAILARVEVIQNNEKTQLKILDFTDLDQDALPTLTTKPTTKDRVKMGWLHDRILLIAPNKKSYHLVAKAQKNKTFIDPDMFAVHISTQGHPSVIEKDLKNFCKAYDVGIVEFIIDKQLFKVDANSFKVLEKIAVDFPKEKTQVPFYTRLKDFNADWWGEGSGEIENYKEYYLSLLGEKND